MPKILIATTIAPWKATERGGLAWLHKAEERVQIAREAGFEIEHFIAIEVDGRGYIPYEDFFNRLDDIGEATGCPLEFWKFMLDQGQEFWDSENRLPRICFGRDLAHEYIQRRDHDAILFIDTDVKVPPDCIPKLWDVGRPLTAGHVPNYGLEGPVVQWRPESCRRTDCDWIQTCVDGPPCDDEHHYSGEHHHVYPYRVEEFATTAGFLMISRDVARALRWRVDKDAGMTDDPCFQADAVKMGFGMTYVRRDVVGVHVEPLIAVEAREKELRRYYR